MEYSSNYDYDVTIMTTVKMIITITLVSMFVMRLKYTYAINNKKHDNSVKNSMLIYSDKKYYI